VHDHPQSTSKSPFPSKQPTFTQCHDCCGIVLHAGGRGWDGQNQGRGSGGVGTTGEDGVISQSSCQSSLLY
jgi:hypothetical protein